VNHLHCVWKLPEGDSDYSIRWALIKKGFTARAKAWAEPVDVSASRKKHLEGGLWQHRFWEHTIRDERDFVAHCDYVHCNPVRHGFAAAPKDWPWSTFRRLVAQGAYPEEWGAEPVAFDAGVGPE
jgi:putative transposase